MKTASLKILLLLSLIALLFLNSCSREPNCNETSYETVDLTADELRKIPYTGFDTLYFLNKQGDTCIVRGTGKQYYYDSEDRTGTPDCPPVQTSYYQAYKIHFIPIKGDLQIEFTQSKINGNIEIDLVNEMYNDPYYWIDYDFLDTKGQGGWQYQYIDTIFINNITYTGVYSMLIARNGMVINDTSYNGLINHIEGILRLRSEKEGKEYTLISKP